MLTTAVSLVSIGAEPANSHPVSSEQINTESGLFANAFDEKVASAGEAQPKIADAKVSQNMKDGKSSAAAQHPHGSADSTTGAKKGVGIPIQGELKDAASARDSKDQNTKGATALLSGAKAAASEAAEPQKSKSKANTSAVPKASVNAPVEAPLDDSLDVPDNRVTAGNVPFTGQTSSTSEADAPRTEASDGTAAPATDASTSAGLLQAGHGQKVGAPDQKELEIADPETSSKVAVKEQGDVGKTGKPSKPEKKDEKAAVSAGNAAGIEAQIQMTMTVPAIAASSDGQPNKPNEVVDDTVSAAPTSASGITLGKSGRLGAAGNNSKVPISTAKTDAAAAKDATATAPGDPASLKATPDPAKAAARPSASVIGSDTKGQGDVTAVSPLATHSDGGVAGTVAGVMAGTTAAQTVVSKPQTEAAASSAGAMQAGAPTGPGALGGSQVDAAPKTLMASPTTLEVGVPNGTHGWLKIRAEMTSGGVVDASLSTSSPSGQEMLHRELPSLTTYLQNEHVAVNTVVVQPAAAAGADFRGLAGGMNGDGRGQAQSGGQGGERRQETAGAVLNHAESVRSYVHVPGIGGDDLLSTASYAGGGSWLSVRA
ncbi:MAG: hypothetical protein BGO25_17465 [Acidobacteriales bacterium 59-55]|nr:hypothetical protein [Terriglobales bacterium]OJV41483.1 MAG: hypothetical protein BGO25_17465 [Acidobacteriales bacterium 59-55]